MIRQLSLLVAASVSACVLQARIVGDRDTDGSTGAGLDARAGVSDPPAEIDTDTHGPLHKLDLLLAIDNSGSMKEAQTRLAAPLPLLADAIARAGYDDVRIGVVSSDLGTGRWTVPGCAGDGMGDDGVLDPIARGPALQVHLPWNPLRGERRPDGFVGWTCSPPSPGRTPWVAGFGMTTDGGSEPFVACHAGLFINGCGLESQLESIHRALVLQGAYLKPGASVRPLPNEGFLRGDAALAIVMLSDEEDGSVRNCAAAHDPLSHEDAPCDDTSMDVYNLASTRWASTTDANLRAYLYQQPAEGGVGGPKDPTWRLDRYVVSSDPRRGWFALKPGHPERIVFLAITGVPLELPTRDGRTDWDALLGAPTHGNRDDFAGRDLQTAYSAPTAQGRVAMTMERDPDCAGRVVPSCFDPRTTASSTPRCTAENQYFAWPARRIVEIARRFDEGIACGGRPCRNGLVTSICAVDYQPAMVKLGERLQAMRGGG